MTVSSIRLDRDSTAIPQIFAGQVDTGEKGSICPKLEAGVCHLDDFRPCAVEQLRGMNKGSEPQSRWVNKLGDRVGGTSSYHGRG